MSQIDDSGSEQLRNVRRQLRFVQYLSVASIIVAIVALLIRSPITSSQGQGFAPSPSCSVATPTSTEVVKGEQGLSAYDLWKALGNKGTVQDFLVSLIGEPGPAGKDGKVIYIGSNGQTGAQVVSPTNGVPGANGSDGINGTDGKSAYQFWLDAGNTGTANDFLVSLIGPAGAQGPAGAAGTEGQDGVNGLSAYELWLATGHEGDEEAFFNSLAGVSGTNGTNGADGDPGHSAYDIWIALGNVGTEGQFLATLVGAQGAPGAPGLCTVGETGAQGAKGDSAYQVWLSAGNVGSEAIFFASLTGPQGPIGVTGSPGPTGDRGPKGDVGPAGTGSLGYYGSFYDVNDQFLVDGTSTSWTFSNRTGASNGVTIEANGHGYSRIRFPAKGMYNIAFSTVFKKTNSNADYVDIWFNESGTPIPDSNTRITIAGQSETVAAWNFFYDCTDPAKYIEVMWYTPSANIYVDAIPESTAPARPATPSIILTVNQVGESTAP